MAVRTVRIFPDDVLKRRAEPVAAVDDEARRLLDDMAETMYHSNGIGLAAPQVGVSLRVLVVDVPADIDDGTHASGLVYVVNPRIIAREGSVTLSEGCLSFPELYVDVKRAERVRVAYLDRDGAGKVVDADGLLSVCLQHEIDHLDGILFTDRLGPVSRRLALREFDKLRARAAAEP
jgi:peptide deformylase